MTIDREPLEEFKMEEVSENNPLTKNDFQNSQKHLLKEKMKDLEFDNAQKRFIKSLPDSINTNIFKRASKRYLASGEWTSHKKIYWLHY